MGTQRGPSGSSFAREPHLGPAPGMGATSPATPGMRVTTAGGTPTDRLPGLSATAAATPAGHTPGESWLAWRRAESPPHEPQQKI